MSKKTYVVFSCLMMFISLALLSCKTSRTAVNAGDDGIAIKGYDTVAYFTMGRPLQGDEQFAYEWNGAKWLFASQEHLDLFAADPEKYAPQYGGY